jgi:hypothetical protein
MGHVLKIKCVDSRVIVNVHILASKSVPLTLTTVSAKFSTNSHETDYSVDIKCNFSEISQL